MNYGSVMLIIIGGFILVVGVSGQAKTVCQAISGSTCDWLPGKSSLTESASSKSSATGSGSNVGGGGGTNFSSPFQATPSPAPSGFIASFNTNVPTNGLMVNSIIHPGGM